MENLGKDLDGLDEPGTRPVEVGIAVGEVSPVVAHCPQLLPDRIFVAHRHLALGRRNIVAARCHQDHVWIALHDLFERDPR